MSNDNPFRQFVDSYAALLKTELQAPFDNRPGGLQASPERSRKALIFAPHPDDECIIGGLALRLLRESSMAVKNIAVTLGNHLERRPGRWRELERACAYLGFDLLLPAKDGLENITFEGREAAPEEWSTSVAVVADMLDAEQPDVIFLPHDQDWHPTHIGTHHLVLDALSTMPAGFGCLMIETEFWQAMARPNLMVESSAEDVADLVAALSCHVGEVERNAYHLRLPAWMIDNVRRGAELVQGRGAAAPDMAFATLYRIGRWRDGCFQSLHSGGKIVSAKDDLNDLID